MTEIEKAIDRLSVRAENLRREIFSDSIGCISHRKRHLDDMDLAIEALQEKAEREKGCPFCCYTEYPDKTLYPKDGYLFYAGYSKQIAPDDFHEEEIEDIKICPMCGRRLGESNG